MGPGFLSCASLTTGRDRTIVNCSRTRSSAKFNAGPLFKNSNSAVDIVDNMTGFICFDGHAIGLLSNDVTFVNDGSTAPGHHALLRPSISTFTSLNINLAGIG